MKIEIKSIKKAFGKKVVLKEASFTCNSGQCVGIIGVNGSGKSTLFSILAGVQRAEGDFLADGVSLLSGGKKAAASVGYIPQGTPLIEELSALDNLLLWYTRGQIEAQLADPNSIICRFGVNGFLKTAVRKMSGGMKKRLAIVCAVSNNPDIIIMDEPSASLDIICKKTIGDFVSSLKQAGKTVILATHEEQEIALCDVIYILKEGVLTPFSGDIKEIAERIR